MTCMKCGNTLKENAKFCNVCGSQLSKAEPGGNSGKRSGNVIIFALAALLVVFAGGVLIYVLDIFGSPEDTGAGLATVESGQSPEMALVQESEDASPDTLVLHNGEEAVEVQGPDYVRRVTEEFLSGFPILFMDWRDIHAYLFGEYWRENGSPPGDLPQTPQMLAAPYLRDLWRADISGLGFAAWFSLHDFDGSGIPVITISFPPMFANGYSAAEVFVYTDGQFQSVGDLWAPTFYTDGEGRLITAQRFGGSGGVPIDVSFLTINDGMLFLSDITVFDFDTQIEENWTFESGLEEIGIPLPITRVPVLTVMQESITASLTERFADSNIPSPHPPLIPTLNEAEFYDAFITRRLREIGDGARVLRRYLFDFNGDGILDLFYSVIDGDYHFEVIGFATIRDGNVIELLSGGYNHNTGWGTGIQIAYSISLSDHVLVVSSSHWSYSGSSFYSMNNGSVALIERLSSNHEAWHTGYGDITFYRNGALITEQAYVRAMNNYVPPRNSNFEFIRWWREPVPVPAFTPAPAFAGDGFIISDSNTRLLVSSDLAGLTTAQLRIARNEIYARRGRMFYADDLQAHFNAQSWYVGRIAPADFTEGMLNDIERANVAFIQAEEQRRER